MSDPIIGLLAVIVVVILAIFLVDLLPNGEDEPTKKTVGLLKMVFKIIVIIVAIFYLIGRYL